MIKITCGECSKKLEAPDGAEGKHGRCPECRAVFVITAESGEKKSPPESIKEIIQTETLSGLFDMDYGIQKIVGHGAAECEWFMPFKKHYDSGEAGLAAEVLDEAFRKDRGDGILWFWHGNLYSDLYSKHEEASKCYLVGAKKCEGHRTNLLQSGAEQRLVKCDDVLNATKLFFKAIFAVTESTKAWGNVNKPFYLNQERALQHLRVILKLFEFDEWADYIGNNIPMATQLAGDYVQELVSIIQQFKEDKMIMSLLEGMFPELKNKIEQLACQSTGENCVIKITCRKCGRKLEAPDELEGKQGQCPDCRMVFMIRQNWTSPSTGMEFVWIPQMKMWVGKYEVTNAAYRKKDPGHDSGSYKGHILNKDRQPVVDVVFEDGKSCAGWMTERDRNVLPRGYRYRLPTESEWMMCAQCGDGRVYPWGDEWPPVSGQAGNYADEAAKREHGCKDVISGITMDFL